MAATKAPADRVKVEAFVSPSARKKFKAKAKKNNSSMSEVIRDFVNSYIRK